MSEFPYAIACLTNSHGTILSDFVDECSVSDYNVNVTWHEPQLHRRQMTLQGMKSLSSDGVEAWRQAVIGTVNDYHADLQLLCDVNVYMLGLIDVGVLLHSFMSSRR